jgi:NAD(P)H dehydrogenase (quinone)
MSNREQSVLTSSSSIERSAGYIERATQDGVDGFAARMTAMAKVLVLYYSSFGHMEQMAKAAAEGAREAGADVVIKRVPELVPEAVAKASHYKLDQEAEIATPAELENYDAIIIGAATRYGAIASQMKNFLDQTGPLWAKGALLNKVGSVMVSTATQHGGAELALISTQASLQHHGMIIVPLSYAYQGQMGNDVVRGGAPYGMTTTSDGDGSRQPSAQELEGAKFQGKRVAEIAAKLHG